MYLFPDQIEKISSKISLLATVPTNGNNYNIMKDWINQLSSGEIVGSKTYLDITAGALNLMAQWQDALKLLRAAEGDIPGLGEGALIADLRNAWIQATNKEQVKSDTVLAIANDVAGLASAFAFTAATAAASPELLAIGVLAGIAALAIGAASAQNVDITPIINAVYQFPTTLSALDSELATAVTLGRMNSDGSVLGFLAGIQGIPANQGGVDGAEYAALYPITPAPTASALQTPAQPRTPALTSPTYVDASFQPAIVNLGSDFAGGGSITASVSGNDLLLTGGSGKVIEIQNWLSTSSLTINLPNGQSWSRDSLAAAMGTGSTSVSFQEGTVFDASAFESYVDALGTAFQDTDTFYGQAFGVGSYIQSIWNQGLQYPEYAGTSPDGTAMYQYGFSSGLPTSAGLAGQVSSTDPAADEWAQLTYDFWQDTNGNWKFAVVNESSGLGGQHIAYNEVDGTGGNTIPEIITTNWSQTPVTTYTPPSPLDLYDSGGSLVSGSSSIQGRFSQVDGPITSTYIVNADGSFSKQDYQNGVLVDNSYTWADGSSSGQVYDGTGALSYGWSDDGHGTVTRTSFDSEGDTIEDVLTNGVLSSVVTYSSSEYRETLYNTSGSVTEDHVYKSDGSQANYVKSTDGSVNIWTSDAAGDSTNYELHADGSSVSSYNNQDGSYGSTVDNTDGSSSIIQNANGVQTDWEDDGHGDTTKTTTDGLGDKTVVQTTADYIRTTGTYADGSSSIVTAYSDGSQATTSYNADGSGFSSFNGDNQSSITNYGSGGTLLYSDSLIDGNEVTRTYTAGILTSEVKKNSDGSSSETDWDANGLLSQASSTDIAGNTVVKEYQNGVLLADYFLNADGTSSGETYDSSGDILTQWNADTFGVTTVDVTSSTGIPTEWVYSASGSLTSQKQTLANGLSSGTYDNADGTVTYWATDSSGTAVTMNYDLKGGFIFSQGITSSSVSFTKSGSDLIVNTAIASFDVSGFYVTDSSANQLTVSFGDGTQWSFDTQTEASTTFRAGVGAEITALSQASSNLISMSSDIAPANVRTVLDANGNLELSVANTNDTLLLQNWSFPSAAQATAIEFSDGTTWTYNDVEGLLANGGVGPTLTDGGVGVSSFAMDGGIALAQDGTSSTMTLNGISDVLLYNVGDGNDSVTDSTSNLTISLGSNISWNDLSLEQVNADLILNISGSGQIDLNSYFNSTPDVRLQLIGTTDNLGLHAETIDVGQLVAEFTAAGPQSTPWSIENALTNMALTTETNQVYGGDIAAYYALNGTLGGMSANVAQAVLKDPSFGTTQALTDPSQWQNGKYQLLA